MSKTLVSTDGATARGRGASDVIRWSYRSGLVTLVLAGFASSALGQQLSPANQKVLDIKGLIANVSDQGRREDFSGEPAVANLAESHCQGIAVYGNYSIISYNNKGYSKGYLILVDNRTKKIVNKISTPTEHYNHPGGMQVIGDYLAVSCATADSKNSYVWFYSLNQLDNGALPLMPYNIKRDGKDSAAVGVTTTRFKDGSGKMIPMYRTVVAVFGDGVDFYVSKPGKSLNDQDCSFEPLANISFPGNLGGYSSICLVTDAADEVYLVGFRTTQVGLDIAPIFKDDYVDLFKVKFADKAFEQLQSRHMYAKHGRTKGSYGVHFRFVGNLQILGFNKIAIYAGQRNFAGGYYTINVFE